jgi:hypothetical protein
VSSEIFADSTRSDGKYAGVFEDDGDVAWFYLYKLLGEGPGKVVGAVKVFTENPGIEAADVRIVWNAPEENVALEIRGRIWAVFNVRTGRGYGGNYQTGREPEIPLEELAGF